MITTTSYEYEGSMWWCGCIGETGLSIVLFLVLSGMTLYNYNSRGVDPELCLWQLQTVGGLVLVVVVCQHSFWGHALLYWYINYCHSIEYASQEFQSIQVCIKYSGHSQLCTIKQDNNSTIRSAIAKLESEGRHSTHKNFMPCCICNFYTENDRQG